jgi:DNA-binding NtrC family response regulator
MHDQALALIDTQAFDAALPDMNLDGNKSHDVAEALAARGVPVVFSTGYSSLEMKDAYRGRPVLKKPFMYEALSTYGTSIEYRQRHRRYRERAQTIAK